MSSLPDTLCYLNGEYTSLAVVSGSPWTCSGLAYAGVIGSRSMSIGRSPVTALAISVAAASATLAFTARTVTASAMPSEKLRPRQPEEATPRGRSDAATRSPPPTAAPAGLSFAPPPLGPNNKTLHTTSSNVADQLDPKP